MRVMFAGLLALGLAACGPAAPKGPTAEDISAESARLNAYLDAEYEKELAFSPESKTYQGRKDDNDKLDDRSEAAHDKYIAWRRESVANLKKQFDPAKLDEEARTSYDVWVQALDRDEKIYTFRRKQYLFGQLGGDHTGLPQLLMTQHQVDDANDMKAYIARVGLVATALDQDVERLKLEAGEGVRMPRFVYDKVLDEIKKLTTGAPFTKGADSDLYADGKAKIAALVKAGKATAEEGKALEADLAKAMTTSMLPGYHRLAEWLSADRANTTEQAVGMGALPGGAEAYNAMLSVQTTTDMTADQIHELGLAEVKRIHGEMEAIKDKVGFKGTLQEFFKSVRDDKRFYYPNDDKGREAYITDADAYLKAITGKLPEFFGKLPKAPLVVKRVESFREVAGGAQHYYPATPDGSRPGIYYAHLIDMKAMPKYQMENIAYHEGLPGHHMQISIQQELTGIPKFRTQYGYTAYQEGWGLYSEALAKEMGGYTDPYNDFGRLGGENWRAIRLVLDTGIHAKGWTEEQAVKYFTENSANSENQIRSEVRRYFTSPGQATCYKIGMIKLQELRDLARKELGAKFSYPKFHDVVLGGGALPLPVLEARVKRWIEKEKAAT